MLFSIITINRNNASGLKKTMESVVGQAFDDFEYIVIDGASTDDSVQVIREYADRSYKIKWVSEPDSGIYNAMNKGIAMSSGEYLFFMNSGDLFSDINVLSLCAGEMNGVDFVIGRVNTMLDGTVTGQSKLLEDSDLSLYNMYLKGIPHQAAFIRRQMLVDNPYDESLKINSDWKFFVQSIVLNNASVKSVSQVVANYDTAGVSSMNLEYLLKEREVVFKQLVPERVADDYLIVFPHYYEVKRVKWLLDHPAYYKIYRMIVSAGMRLLR